MSYVHKTTYIVNRFDVLLVRDKSIFSVKAETAVFSWYFLLGISPTDDTFSITLSPVIALTSECAVSELAASELAVLVTSELSFFSVRLFLLKPELVASALTLWQLLLEA